MTLRTYAHLLNRTVAKALMPAWAIASTTAAMDMHS